ncbi:MAG: hypothetical protein IKO16_04345 [Lachnospiraceae bacterium]|nr:hypothetical protein [Lachnospiraceae bacterium]
MSILTVDYVSFRNSTGQIMDLFLKIGDEVDHIVDYTKELDIFWDGEANSAYIGRVGSDITAIAEIAVKIRDTIRLLGMILDIYMENEREVQKLLGECRL